MSAMWTPRPMPAPPPPELTPEQQTALNFVARQKQAHEADMQKMVREEGERLAAFHAENPDPYDSIRSQVLNQGAVGPAFLTAGGAAPLKPREGCDPMLIELHQLLQRQVDSGCLIPSPVMLDTQKMLVKVRQYIETVPAPVG